MLSPARRLPRYSVSGQKRVRQIDLFQQLKVDAGVEVCPDFMASVIASSFATVYTPVLNATQLGNVTFTFTFTTRSGSPAIT